MADNYQIGNVEIQISSTADKAAQSLTNLSNRLSNLGSSANIGVSQAKASLNTLQSTLISQAKERTSVRDLNSFYNSELSNKSAKESASVFVQAEKAKSKAIKEAELAQAQAKERTSIRDLNEFYNSELSNKSAKESASVFVQAEKAQAKAIKEAEETEKAQAKAIKETEKAAKRSSLTLGGLKLSMIAIAHAARLVGRFIASSITLSADYIESLNMMEVAFGSASSEAYDFAKSLNTAFSVDTAEAIKYVSIFKQISSAIGVASDTATTMSEALTQIGYDISSLYNITVEEAMTKLEAGVVGQTKPLRSLGIDVTAASIDRLLKEEMKLSIGNRQLSQADKQIARTIIILRAGGNAWGDYAKTINTFSNQQKIFTSLITQAKRAIGDFFVRTGENAGIATKALWYINGALMAVVSVLRAFIPETTSTGLNTLSNNIEDTAEATDDLNAATKNLSFDKFNALTDSTGTSSLYGDLLSTELADTYAEYLVEWNKKLEDIDYKAKTIRDDIMSWLGFTKNVDSATGDVSFTFDKLSDSANELFLGLSLAFGVSMVANLAKVITSLKGINLALTAIGGSKVVLIVGTIIGLMVYLYKTNDKVKESLNSLFEAFSNLFSVVAPSFTKLINTLLPAIIKLVEIITPVLTFLVNLFTNIVDIYSKFISLFKGGNDTTGVNGGGSFATGGFPAQGEMFIARESGAELVGSIGNQTAVVNNDQIVSAVSSGVASAVAKTLGRSGSQKVEVSFNPNGSAIARAIMPFLTAENKNQNYVLSKA